MVELSINNTYRTSKIGQLVKYLYGRDFDDETGNPLSLRIEKKGDDLMVIVEWADVNFIKSKPHVLSYRVGGLKDLIGSFLNDYTITDIDTKLNDYIKTANLDTKLNDYIKTANLDTKLNDYIKTANLDTKLNDYIKTANLDTKLNDYIKTANLDTKLNDYIKTTNLDTKLNDCIKTTALDAKLSGYTKIDGSNMTEDIQNKLMGHHAAQVFDFLSSLETEYNAMHG